MGIEIQLNGPVACLTLWLVSIQALQSAAKLQQFDDTSRATHDRCQYKLYSQLQNYNNLMIPLGLHMISGGHRKFMLKHERRKYADVQLIPLSVPFSFS